MCDTMVYVPPEGDVIFAKNSDREPGEAQIVELLAAGATVNGKQRCTYVTVDVPARRHEIVISRPTWMWGCEMGSNEHGLTVGNEAVFTRVPVERTGLLGMDLQRLALEHTSSADEALDYLVRLLTTIGQGGSGGYRSQAMRYHNSFIIADPGGAWALETAGRFWAAKRVRGAYSLSNVLTIGKDFDRVHPDAAAYARSRGWSKRGEDLDFARTFGAPVLRRLTGGDLRLACTRRALAAIAGDPASALSLATAALRDHAGLRPDEGWVMRMPCAHATLWPTRSAGQTTASMVSKLSRAQAVHWLTGTSSPCLSVFKPIVLGGGRIDTAPTSAEKGFDERSLFWRHERLHRIALASYGSRSERVAPLRCALEQRAFSNPRPTATECASLWQEHYQQLPEWTALVAQPAKADLALTKRLYWRWQSWRDGVT